MKETAMLTYPELTAIVAKQHANELIEEASRYRLAAALRRGRRQLWPDSLPRSTATVRVPDASSTRGNTVAPVSRLDPCEVRPAELAQGRAR
jgi:hypothetical protein